MSDHMERIITAAELLARLNRGELRPTQAACLLAETGLFTPEQARGLAGLNDPQPSVTTYGTGVEDHG